MDIEPVREDPDRAPTEPEREAAAERLADAAGDGRLTLEEFADRVGAVWAADRWAALERATAGIVTPVVGSTHTVANVVSVMGDQWRTGRWRLPARLRGWAVMGDIVLDLRSAICSDPEIEITAFALMGDVDILVPDGVEVEVTGFTLMGDKEIRLAPVARIPGTPLIRVRAYAVMGDVTVGSAGVAADVRGWRRWIERGKLPGISAR
jgi:hypothetical protein